MSEITGSLVYLTSKEACEFLLPRHYSGRNPSSISKAYGWVVNDKLVAVATYGKPANHFLCDGICGKEWNRAVYELSRLCREEDLTLPLSQFVSATLRDISQTNDWIIVSYADTAQTKERTDPYSKSGKHNRHLADDVDMSVRVRRSAKHRYVYFCTRDKRLKQQWMHDLRYPVLPYPKGDNKNYVLGTYIKQDIVSVGNEEH